MFDPIPSHPISNKQLVEVAELSGKEAAQSKFIEELKQDLKAKIPNPEEIESKDAKNSYLFLKHNLSTWYRLESSDITIDLQDSIYLSTYLHINQ